MQAGIDLFNLTLFWFAMFMNEYELEFEFRKCLKDANLGSVYISSGLSFVMSRTDAQNKLHSIFKANQ